MCSTHATADEGHLDAQVLDFIQSGKAFGAAPDRRIDTHAASVFLTRDRAWKLKRPVRLDYLDFSTLESRRRALEAELALNTPLAPALYRRLHPITRDRDGLLRLDGSGHTVEWVLEMNRFDDGALLSEIADREGLGLIMLQNLVDRIVSFHETAPIRGGPGGAVRLQGVLDGNRTAMRSFPNVLPEDAVAALAARIDSRAAALSALLETRGVAGRIRHGHGDLHLGNIALIDGSPTPFDRLEFDPELATCDVLYDLAFLVMDLWNRGRRQEANLVFNRYLDLSPADEPGVALMGLFMAVRACVRAHVEAARAAQTGDAAHAAATNDYFQLANECLDQGENRLIAVGGLSGTGKSAFARSIADEFGPVPGARLLRSDVLRKRLAGAAPETPLAPAAYRPENNHRVYDAIRGLANQALQCGQAVIADAAFLRANERAAIAQVAASQGVRFDGVWLEASKATRIARVSARYNDASDAGVEVVQAQAEADLEPIAWSRLSAEPPLDIVTSTGLQMLGATTATMRGNG